MEGAKDIGYALQRLQTLEVFADTGVTARAETIYFKRRVAPFAQARRPGLS